MTSITYPTKGRGFGRRPGVVLPAEKRRLHQEYTTTVERVLLMATAIVIPFEYYLPVFGRFSSPYIMFAILAVYTVAIRPRALARTGTHPVFLSAFALLLIGSLIEFSHPFPRYTDIFRMGPMIVGAIFVATLCRDRRALRATINGYLIAGVLVSIIFFLTSYGALRATTATDFGEASRIRADVFGDVEGNLNALAIATAQGVAVALALGLHAKSSLRRKLFFGIALFGGIATFLPMSRSGMAIVALACAVVMYSYGLRHVRVILVAVALAIGTLILIPDAVFSRFSFSQETPSGKMEARARIYQASIDHLPEYILTGVGAGNFRGPWGIQSGYYERDGGGQGVIKGAHNAFIQITIFWGVTGLLLLIVVVYLAYRCLPKGGGRDMLVLCLYGISLTLLLRMMVLHGLADKEYSIGLGILVGSSLWIWSRKVVPPLRRVRSPRYAMVEHTS